MLPPAQSRTNLGHISLSSYYTKQFSLSHHAHQIQPYPSSRWTGETLLVELPPILAHPTPITWRFPDCQITALTTQAPNSPLPVNPPPTDLHTGSRRDSPPISTVCQHTPVPLFPHPQPLPFCKSQLTSPLHTSCSYSPSFLHANFVAIRHNKFSLSGDSNQVFSSRGLTS